MNKRLPTTLIGKAVLQLRLLLLALIILSLPFTTAAQADFTSVDAFLKSTLKGADRLSLEARGHLNGDGLEDWAGVIERQKSDSSSTSQLYVLLRLRQDGYRIGEKSREAPITGMGCCWVENLEINRSSIYVQSNVKLGSTMEASTYQFKLHQGEWRLIGVRIFKLDVNSDASIETDMNVLTGSVLESGKRVKTNQ
jgi:hypothetical protein